MIVCDICGEDVKDTKYEDGRFYCEGCYCTKEPNNKLIYIPTKEEKKELNNICNEVILLITKKCNNHIGKMAFVVNNLFVSFKDSARK